MNIGVFEITNIERHNGLTEADSMRIGRRVIPTQIIEGYNAILVHEDNHDKAVFTSPITRVDEKNENIIRFTTWNTSYKLRKVSE